MGAIWIGRGSLQSLCPANHDGDLRVTLLLLLSALLSAFTGSSDSVGRSVAPQAVSRGVAVAVAASQSVRQRAFRPAAAMPMVHTLASPPMTTAIDALIGAPVYTNRRRE